MTPKKEKEPNQRLSHQISAIGDNITRKQDVSSGAAMTFSNYHSYTFNLSPETPKIPQPKIDATDRRQIEALNEDKAHTTKEELDDIKRTHYKEKKKKEQNNMERYETGIKIERAVKIGWLI